MSVYKWTFNKGIERCTAQIEQIKRTGIDTDRIPALEQEIKEFKEAIHILGTEGIKGLFKKTVKGD
jgi:hypothetical protein